MNNEKFSPEKKIRWISKVYFGVLDSPTHDVNPFEELAPFLDATVKQLDWGKTPAEITESKKIFCKHFMHMLDLYDFHVPEEEIMSCLNNNNMQNRDVIAHFASVGKFVD